MPEVRKLGPGNYLVDGVPKPSVTTVIEVLDKSEALMPWASKVTADHIWEAYTNNGQITEEDCKKARAMPHVIKREAGEWGTQLHHLAETITRGGRPNLLGCPPEVLVALQGWMKWWLESRLTPVVIEGIVYLAALDTPGTLDLIALTLDGRRILIDYKTSNYLHAQFKMQTVAYVEGWEEENFPEQIDEIWILRFEKDEEKFEKRPWELHTVPRADFPQHLAGFKACRDLYRWREAQKGARKGRTIDQ